MIYIAAANQKARTDVAITALVRWELTAKSGGADEEYRFTVSD